MADGFPANGTTPTGPDDFGREVRRLALDARRILGRTDAPIDELIALHARTFHLLRAVPGTHTGGIRGWLLAVRRRVADRLEAWAAEALPSQVA